MDNPNKPPSTSNLQSAGMPNDDGGARIWLDIFARSLEQHRDLWPVIGIRQPDVELITALVQDFDEKYMLAYNPATRTRPNILAKTLARHAAVAAIRPWINQIKANPLISESQRLSLNINPKNTAEKQRARHKRRLQTRIQRIGSR